METKKKIIMAAIVIIALLVIGIVVYFVTITTQRYTPVTYHFAFSATHLGHPYWGTAVEGAKAAVADIKAKTGDTIELTVFDPRYDPVTQAAQIETIIGAGVYDFYIGPPVVEEALVTSFKKLYEAGIPIITYDFDIAPAGRQYRLVCISTNNIEAGSLCVEKLMEVLGKSGKPKPWNIVVFYGAPGGGAAEDRKRGHDMALRMYEEQGDIKVVAAEWGYWDREKVASMMEAILAKEKVDGVVCSNDDMAMGAITAIKSAGLVPNRDVYVAGFDAIEEAVKAVREGTMALTITQAPYVEAYWSVLAAYLHLKKGWVPVTGYIPTPFFAVTKENVDTFSSQVLTPRMDLWSRYGPTIDQL